MIWTSGDTSATVGVVTLVGSSMTFVLFRFVLPKLKAIARFLRDWEGEPARPDDGVPERPGMLKRMSLVEGNQASLATDVSWIKQQLKPNDGKSFYDKVSRAVDNQPVSQPTTVVNVHTDGKETTTQS